MGKFTRECGFVRGSPILEVKRRLDGVEERYPCAPALVEPGRRAVLVYVLERTWNLPGLALRAGTTTFAHFWMDRPYNVYHWLEDERTVGHYFNVGRCVEIAAERVLWTDYVVDVLVTPDGATRVLDEDELGPDTEPQVREVVERARALILRDVAALVAEVELETRRLRR